MLLSRIIFALVSASSCTGAILKTPQEPDVTAPGVGKAGSFLLDVLVGQDVLVASVGSRIILEDKAVGFHLVVLDERHGELLQHLFYNVSDIAWSEQLVHFLNTIKDGRIVVLGAQGVSSEAMSNETQRYLTLLGSQYAKSLTPRGQWAMVVEKGYPVLAENRTNGSVSSDIWGGPVHLHFEVVSTLDNEKNIDTCGNLLTNGHLGEFNEWHPDGCRMHQYSTAEATTCFQRVRDKGRHTHLVFVGDSRIRYLYAAFMTLVDPLETWPEGHRGNRSYVDEKSQLVTEYFRNTYVDQNMTEHFNIWRNQSDPPQLIVAGAATWSIRDFSGAPQGVEEYARNLTQLIPAFDALAKKNTTVLWTLQEPSVQERLKESRENLTNEQIFLYNDAAIKTLRPSSVRLWSSIRRIAEGNLIDSEDGLHHGQLALMQDSQILLNIYCNQYMQWSADTCCTKSAAEAPPTFSKLQVATFSFLGICVVLAVVLYALRWIQILRDQDAEVPEPGDVLKVVSALAKLGVVMAYFYLCDRTHLFNTDARFFSPIIFWLPLLGFLILGLVFHAKTEDTRPLNRSQTEEWKGWMQLVILVYHITAGSKILPIYMHLRVIVSAYLFMTGYGHFCFIWKNGQATFSRYLQVLFRLNFMTVMLCICMDRPYQNYYYVPLATFWFTVVYVALIVPPRIMKSTDNHVILLAVKLFVIVFLITLLYLLPGVFKAIFTSPPWSSLFTLGDPTDVTQWWFRWQLDRYSTWFGMTFAGVLLIAPNYVTVDMDKVVNQLIFAGSAVVGIVCYTVFSFLCPNKVECNNVHSYVAFVPIVAFVILRNFLPWLRSHYSTFFAWFGGISLELFIGQYHIWLGANAKRVLVIVPGLPIVNVIYTSVVFVLVAWQFNKLTGVLLPYVVPKENRLAIRNCAVIVILMVFNVCYSYLF